MQRRHPGGHEPAGARGQMERHLHVRQGGDLHVLLHRPRAGNDGHGHASTPTAPRPSTMPTDDRAGGSRREQPGRVRRNRLRRALPSTLRLTRARRCAGSASRGAQARRRASTAGPCTASVAVSPAGAGGRLEVDLLAARRVAANAGRTRRRCRVGRLVRSSLRAGSVPFAVALDAMARRALRRRGRLVADRAGSCSTPAHGSAVTITRRVARCAA